MRKWWCSTSQRGHCAARASPRRDRLQAVGGAAPGGPDTSRPGPDKRDNGGPDHATPERTSLWAGDAALSRRDALKAALAGEKKGYEFYYTVAKTSALEEVRAMAREFVQEEAEHVRVLEAWILREEWLAKARSFRSPPPG